SSAERRSAVVRSSTRTMRASVPAVPLVSPTTPTRSPTTTAFRAPRPSSRAFIATTRPPPAGRTVYRPRSTASTRAGTASSCRGRTLVRGREPRLDGRPRTRSSSVPVSRPRLIAPSSPPAAGVDHGGPHPGEVGQRLGGGGDVEDLGARQPQSDDGGEG